MTGAIAIRSRLSNSLTVARLGGLGWASIITAALVLAPIAVGFAAEQSSWSVAVSATAVFPLLALAIILARFPETKGKELEETARI